uniref:Uncharacterized protein n=1 Tax=Helianthus annuus TaxID=4232 RepID=A0A251SN10_HELAN
MSINHHRHPHLNRFRPNPSSLFDTTSFPTTSTFAVDRIASSCSRRRLGDDDRNTHLVNIESPPKLCTLPEYEVITGISPEKKDAAEVNVDRTRLVNIIVSVD